jgi:ATP-dependent RNA helicase DeaD
LAQELLARQSPEAIAAALIRLYRARLPEPAPVTILPPEAPRRAAREPAAPYGGEAGTGSWFRAPVGRRDKADPKWLIPLICRQGGVTKPEIGAIRIFDTETKFEIAPHAAERFAASIAAHSNAELPLEPSTPPGAGRGGPRPHAPRPPRADKPARPPFGGKPNEQQRRRQNKAKRAG